MRMFDYRPKVDLNMATRESNFLYEPGAQQMQIDMRKFPVFRHQCFCTTTRVCLKNSKVRSSTDYYLEDTRKMKRLSRTSKNVHMYNC